MKRYEVWCRTGADDVRVAESDLEIEVRVLVDGVEVYHLSGLPSYAPQEAEQTALIVTGGRTTGTYTDDKGKKVKNVDKEWKS